MQLEQSISFDDSEIRGFAIFLRRPTPNQIGDTSQFHCSGVLVARSRRVTEPVFLLTITFRTHKNDQL